MTKETISCNQETEKLYYQDAYCKSFTAIVRECRSGKTGYEIILDRTAFYPEGGGQPGDRGVLKVGSGEGAEECILVSDTIEKEGRIIHITDRPLTPGMTVTGELDWLHRFDLMQNHSGEHIVSGLIHKKLGCSNVGFHMGEDFITVDFDAEFTQEDMREFERQANEIIWNNDETDIRLYRKEEIADLEYRSKKELHGQVRIVTFPGADICACCGTHVKRTGEIGLIKLLSLQKFKGGVRMEMLSGRRAFSYVTELCSQNHQISVALSAKPLETAGAVARLKEAAANDAFRMMALEKELFSQKADQLKDAGNVLLIEEGLSADSVRRLAVAVMESCGGRCGVFSGDDEHGYKYAIGEKDGDLRDFVRKMNASLHGRGGGKPFFVQGSISCSRDDIRKFWKEKEAGIL